MDKPRLIITSVNHRLQKKFIEQLMAIKQYFILILMTIRQSKTVSLLYLPIVDKMFSAQNNRLVINLLTLFKCNDI
jgi:hypothetical protein